MQKRLTSRSRGLRNNSEPPAPLPQDLTARMNLPLMHPPPPYLFQYIWNYLSLFFGASYPLTPHMGGVDLQADNEARGQ